MINVSPYKEMYSSRLKYDLPSVFLHLDSLDRRYTEKILTYLENGLVLAEFVSPIPSIIEEKKLIPYVLYSDGKYCWDSMLLHLVKDYLVGLPSKFVDHILNCDIAPNQVNSLNRDCVYKKYMNNKKNLRYLLIDNLEVSLKEL